MSDTEKDSADAPPLPQREIWSARHAWLGTAGLILVSLCVIYFTRLALRTSSTIHDWLSSPSGRFGFDVFRSALWFLVAFLAARSRSLLSWVVQAGLARPPSLSGWFMAWIAIVVGLLEMFFIMRGWEPQSSVDTHARSEGRGFWLNHLFSAIVLAPFCEEAVFRGFLYRAFRGSYNIAVSTALIIAVSDAWFHWGLVSMPLSFFCLVVSTIGLCLIREWTGNSWNCVLFHAAHNAAVLLPWPFFVSGMLLVLPLCSRRGSK